MAGKGRPKTGGGSRLGVPNKAGADIKAMVIGALNAVGGVQYLAERAIDQPVAFMGLIGKVLPLQVTGRDGAPIAVDFRWADASATAVITPVIEAQAEPSEEGDLIEWQAPELAND